MVQVTGEDSWTGLAASENEQLSQVQEKLKAGSSSRKLWADQGVPWIEAYESLVVSDSATLRQQLQAIKGMLPQRAGKTSFVAAKVMPGSLLTFFCDAKSERCCWLVDGFKIRNSLFLTAPRQ